MASLLSSSTSSSSLPPPAVAGGSDVNSRLRKAGSAARLALASLPALTIYSQLYSSGGPAEKERRPRGVAWLEGLDPEAPPGGRSRSDPGTPCGSAERGLRTSTVRPSRLDAAAAARDSTKEGTASYASRGESAWIRIANNPATPRGLWQSPASAPPFFRFNRS